MPDQPPIYVQQKPRGMSCLAKGCVVIASIVALLFIGAFGVGIYVQRQFGSFYGTQRQPLPVNKTTTEQYQMAAAKLQPLLGAGDQTSPATIDLTADDLNALVAHDPRLADAKDKCFFTIPGDQLSADISAEIQQQGQSTSNHVYYNVRVIGGVEIDSGEVRLAPQSVESLSGRQLPGWLLTNSVFKAFVDSFNGELNKGIQNNKDLSAMVERIQAVRIANGHVLLTVGSAVTAPTPVAEPTAKE